MNAIAACALILMLAPAAVAQQPPTFRPVEGPTLQARMEAAITQARAISPPTRFWVAYGFDVRPGLAVDVEVINTNGTISSFSGMNIMMNAGSSFETRNLGVFLLNEPKTDAPVRVEVYNLDRRHTYSGYPVYWLGHARSEESLALLKRLAEPNQANSAIERAIMAIALHDEAQQTRVLLEQIGRTSDLDRARTTAVSWLGQVGGASPFLTDLARREDESMTVRKRAVSSIGASRDLAALSTLQTLYGAVSNREIKRHILDTIANNEYQDTAVNFLLTVARDDPDHDARLQAINGLGQKGGEAVLDELIAIFKKEQDVDIQKGVISALGQIGSPRTQERLVDIARTADNSKLRQRAMRQIARRNDAQAITTLSQLYDTERDEEVQEEILDILGETQSKHAIKKLMAVAQSSASIKVRKKAMFWLGKSNDPDAVTFLERLLKE